MSCDVMSSGLVSLKDLIFHKPATRSACIPSVLRFTYHSVVDVRTKAVRLASNLLYPEAAFRPTVEAFAKQVCVPVPVPVPTRLGLFMCRGSRLFILFFVFVGGVSRFSVGLQKI